MPFGGWLNCENCGLKGDPIRVYQLTYRIDTLAKTRIALEQEFRSKGTFTNDWERYGEFHNLYYEKVERLWGAAQKNASNYGQPYHARRLYDLGLWRDQNTFNKCMADKVGMIHQGQVKDILGKSILGITRKGFTRTLVMPLYWVPGLISGFAFIGNKDIVKYTSVFDDYFGGFFNLTNQAPKADTTYVVDNPTQVLHIALKSYTEGIEFPLVIAPYPVSTADWTGLNGTLVYWHDNPEPENLRKCLPVPSFQIAPTLCPPEWPTDKQRAAWWGDTILPKVIKSISAIRKRKSAIKFCVDTLMSLTISMRTEYLDRINPCARVRELLLKKSTHLQKPALKRLFEGSDMADSIRIKGMTVYERQGQWFLKKKGGPQTGNVDELVSEVVLVLDAVYRNLDRTASSYSGYIIYRDFKIKFVVMAKELEKDPRDYVETICAHAGIETLPHISDWGKSNLVKVAKLFRSPEVIKVRDTVGFDQYTGKFYLPSTIISSTSIEVGGQYVYPSAHLPGERMGYQLEQTPTAETSFNAALLESWLDPYYECAGYWATVASLMYALYSKITGGTATGIVLVGDKGSLAEHLFNIFRYDFDLLRSDLNSYKENRVALYSMDHDLPLAIDGLRCKRISLKSWLRSTTHPNTLLLVDPLYASSMGPDPDWVFIRAEAKPLGSEGLLAGTETAASSILQYMLTVQPTSLQSAFDACSDIAKKLNLSEDVIQRASRLTSEQGYRNSRSELAGFICLVDELTEQGALTPGKEIKVSKDKQTVTINLNLIQQQVKSLRLYDRHWDLRDKFKLFGFTSTEDSSYTGSYLVWARLTEAVSRVRDLQRIRTENYAKHLLK